MAEYIEREALRLAYEKSAKNDNHRIEGASAIHAQEHRHILHILDRQPAADVVEVVRCKDCKYGRLDDYTLKMFCSSPLGSYGCTPTQANNFCSYGVRREER